jgi:hypothetical protein
MTSYTIQTSHIFCTGSVRSTWTLALAARTSARGLGARPPCPPRRRARPGSSTLASLVVAWFPTDADAGAIAAVSTLASHSGPSVVAPWLFHHSCKPPAMAAPPPTRPVPTLGEALAAAAGELGHAASAPLPRRACSRCVAPWPAAVASPPWPVATAPPPWPAAASPLSAPYRDPPPPLKPGSTLEGVDPSIPVSGVPSLRAAAAGCRRGFMAPPARRLLRVGEGALFRGEGVRFGFFFFGRGGWSQVVVTGGKIIVISAEPWSRWGPPFPSSSYPLRAADGSIAGFTPDPVQK